MVEVIVDDSFDNCCSCCWLTAFSVVDDDDDAAVSAAFVTSSGFADSVAFVAGLIVVVVVGFWPRKANIGFTVKCEMSKFAQEREQANNKLTRTH